MPHKRGWIRDLPDQRDHIYSAPYEQVKDLPQSVDLRPGCPPVYDQLELGSCTANAISAAIEFDRIKQQLSPFIPSRLFIYYNEREMEGTIESDSGAMIRDGIKSVNKLGACNETEWPYDISQFRQRPDDQCYKDALLDKAVSYQRVTRNLEQMQACLASGYPFVYGFSVYASFESQDVAGRGIVPMPMKREQLLGGHAVLCVGYKNDVQRFICRNSWGSSWAQQGYFEMPYQYLLNKGLASDFWTIKTVG